MEITYIAWSRSERLAMSPPLRNFAARGRLDLVFEMPARRILVQVGELLEQVLLVSVQLLGNLDEHPDQQVPGATARLRCAFAADAKGLPVGSSRRHLHGDRAIEGGYLDLRSQGRLGERDGQVHDQIAVLTPAEDRMGLYFHTDIEIAARPPVGTRGTAPRHLDASSVPDTGRDLDLAALRDRHRGPFDRVHERQTDPRLGVLTTLGAARPEAESPEKVLEDRVRADLVPEEIADVHAHVPAAPWCVVEATSTGLDELSDLVVLGTLLVVREDGVRFRYLLEARLGRLVALVGVGVMFLSELPIGLLDLFLRSRLRHAQDLVVVLLCPVALRHLLLLDGTLVACLVLVLVLVLLWGPGHDNHRSTQDLLAHHVPAPVHRLHDDLGRIGVLARIDSVMHIRIERLAFRRDLF